MNKLFSTLLIFFVASSAVYSQDYYAYVAAESEDEVSLIRYNAKTGEGTLEKTIPVGIIPVENDGPHGINMSLDGKYIFVSIAHGNPYGYLQKFDAETGELLGQTELGLFPASMEISEATGFLYIVNFNLHGDMVPSTVSVVDPDIMEVVAEIPTGVMPHGSRISADGTKQYHVSMMTDELIEINTYNMSVGRRLNLVEKKDGMDHAAMGHEMKSEGHDGHDSDKGHGEEKEGHDKDGDKKKKKMDHMMMKPVVKPTWADPHPTKPLVYVAGNGSDEILEIDTNNWKVVRRLKSGKAPYNLEVTHDGKLLVVSYKGEAKSGIWDLETGKEIARIDNSRKITHGVAISTDNKFAFMSVEGIGGEPGSVDIVDLEKKELVSVVETGKQAGGIIFWKMDS